MKSHRRCLGDCMLMGRIRRSSHIMGFDKVKINTTPFLLLLIEGVVDMALSQTMPHTHTHTHTQTHRHTRTHLPTDTMPAVVLILTQTFTLYAPPLPSSLPLTPPPPPAPLPLSRCLCPRHKHPSIPPPSLFSLLLQRLCLLQWTFMTTHSVRVLFSLPLPLFLLHSPQVKY